MKKLITLLFLLFHVTACSTMTTTEKEQKRNDLDTMAKDAIARLVEQEDGLQEKIDNSLASAVIDIKLTKVPLIGAGGGEGVTVDNRLKKRTYITASRLDLGGGVGARLYKLLIIIDSQEVYEDFKGGAWVFDAGAEASAGTASAEGSAGDEDSGFSMRVLTEGGASATVTARAIRTKVNHDLEENK